MRKNRQSVAEDGMASREFLCASSHLLVQKGLQLSWTFTCRVLLICENTSFLFEGSICLVSVLNYKRKREAFFVSS